MAWLLYGSGSRLMECARLRAKDVDLAMDQITVREGKGRKGRVTLLPQTRGKPLASQPAQARKIHEHDLDAG